MADSNTVNVGSNGDLASAAGVEARFARVDGQIASVKADVAGVKDDVGEIKTGVKDLTAAITSKSAPNWHLLGLILVVAVPLAGWGWSQLGDVRQHLEAATAQFVSRADIQDKFASAKEIADLKAQIVQKDVSRLGDDVRMLQAQIVPLSTHQELWAKQADTNKALSAQIDENRKSLADISAPKETISRFDHRIDALEALARGRGRGTDRAD